MKRIVLFFSFLPLSAIPDFNESARTWIATYAAGASNDDLLTLADFLYYSQRRSEMSLEVQEATTYALQELCNYSVSITQTRLNPSKEISYAFDKKRYSNTQKIASGSLENYFITNKKYTEIINSVLHGDMLKSALVKKGVQQLRQDARSFVAQAINEHIYSLQKSLGEAQKMATSVAALFKQQVFPKIPTRSFLEYIWACVPQFLINSFVSFDTAYAKTHAQFCTALIKEYEAGNTIWLVIESTRGAWYRAHYTALTPVLKERNLIHAAS